MDFPIGPALCGKVWNREINKPFELHLQDGDGPQHAPMFVLYCVNQYTYTAQVRSHSARRSGGEVMADVPAAIVTGIFGFSVGCLTSGITLLRDRSAAKQGIMQFLMQKRQELDACPELLDAIRFLKQEQEAKRRKRLPPEGPKNEEEGNRLRKLPAFLEPVGIFLEYNPATFRKAYGFFSEEVLLCAESSLLWPPNGRFNESVYWRSFNKFVNATREAGYALPAA